MFMEEIPTEKQLLEPCQGLMVNSREFQGYLTEYQRVFQESLKIVLRKFQGCLKKVPSVFEESAKCVSRKFHKKFQGYIKNL